MQFKHAALRLLLLLLPLLLLRQHDPPRQLRLAARRRKPLALAQAPQFSQRQTTCQLQDMAAQGGLCGRARQRLAHRHRRSSSCCCW